MTRLASLFGGVVLLVFTAASLSGCGGGDDPGAADVSSGADAEADGVGAGGGAVDATLADSATATPPCTGDEDCAGETVGACEKSVCDVASGTCVVGTLPDGVPCSDDVCQTGQVCHEGGCAPGDPAAAACGAAECGLDACGNACGTCQDGWSCTSDGLCVDEAQLTCDNLTYEGCCTPDGALFWCADGDVGTLDCAGEGSTCGWSSTDSFYVCGAPENSDPAGANEWLCPGYDCDDPCGGRDCGSRCGVSCGGCDDGSICTDTGQCMVCSCDGKACGEDACGNACGSCDGDLLCVDNQCIESSCDGLTYEGCCDELVLTWCEDGALETIACETSCGWSTDDGFYNCNQEGAEPSGTWPLACEEPLPPVDEDPGDPGPEMVEAVEAVEAVPDAASEVSAAAGDAEAGDVGPTPMEDVPVVPTTDVPTTDPPPTDAPLPESEVTP